MNDFLLYLSQRLTLTRLQHSQLSTKLAVKDSFFDKSNHHVED